MTSLTDRYVHAVLRAGPSSQRSELEPEVRALVADAIDARAGGGATEEAAERAALTELGDPAALAARYAEGPQYLIGPALFPEWKRLNTLLLSTVVPIISAVVLGANLLANEPVGRAITAAGATGINVALQTLFWVTLVFAAIERFAGGVTAPRRTWTPDDLPELPEAGRLGVLEFASSLAANVFVLIGLLWVQLLPPISIEGRAFALFDPALWSFWLPWFIGVTVLEIAFTVVLWMRGRWTMGFAAANAILGAAFAIPAVYLVQNNMLFNPDLVDTVAAASGGQAWIQVSARITAIALIGFVAWDALDGFRKARRSSTSGAS
jgi:hypothetical protein